MIIYIDRWLSIRFHAFARVTHEKQDKGHMDYDGLWKNSVAKHVHTMLLQWKYWHCDHHGSDSDYTVSVIALMPSWQSFSIQFVMRFGCKRVCIRPLIYQILLHGAFSSLPLSIRRLLIIIHHLASKLQHLILWIKPDNNRWSTFPVPSLFVCTDTVSR